MSFAGERQVQIQTTLDCHNARLKLNYCLLPEAPNFRYFLRGSIIRRIGSFAAVFDPVKPSCTEAEFVNV